MNKRQIMTSMAAASLVAAMMAPGAAALNWKDGAPAKYHFTYAADDAGIAGVTASDTNGTFSGEVNVGDTITTQTGTIAWRDSYTNTTTFTVDVKPGYELTGLNGENVSENEFTEVDEDTYTFQFTDKGAEAWCYGKDVVFNLETDAIQYKVNFDADGKTRSIEATVGDSLELSDEPVKEGYTFTGWYLNGEKLDNVETLTEEMILAADEENTINITAKFEINTYNVRINYYMDNMQGAPDSMLDTTVEYMDTPVVSEGYKLVGGGEIAPVTGDTTINMVKWTPAKEDDWSYEYGFLYNSKDEGVESVEYSIDGENWTAIDMNEGVKFTTSLNLLDKRTITFRVRVAGGCELALESNGGNEITRDGEYYTFQFTRAGAQNLNDGMANVSFDLSTK